MTWKELLNKSGVYDENADIVCKAIGVSCKDDVLPGDATKVRNWASPRIGKASDASKAIISNVWDNFKGTTQESDIVKEFQDVNPEDMDMAVAKYNLKTGKNITRGDVETSLEGARRVGYADIMSDKDRQRAKAELDSFLVANGPEHYEELKSREEYSQGIPHKVLKYGSYLADAGASAVPGIPGYAASLVGPAMRAIDDYNLTGEVDPDKLLTDVGSSIAGQAMGGKILKGGSKVAQKLGKDKMAFVLDAADEAGKYAKAEAGRQLDPMIAVESLTKGGIHTRSDMLRAQQLHQGLEDAAMSADAVGDIGKAAQYRAAMKELETRVSNDARMTLRHSNDPETALADLQAADDYLKKNKRQEAKRLEGVNKATEEAHGIEVAAPDANPVTRFIAEHPKVAANADNAASKLATEGINAAYRNITGEKPDPFKETRELVQQYQGKKDAAAKEQAKNEADIKANDTRYPSLPPIERKPKESLNDKYKRWSMGYVTADEVKSPEFKQFKLDKLMENDNKLLVDEE